MRLGEQAGGDWVPGLSDPGSQGQALSVLRAQRRPGPAQVHIAGRDVRPVPLLDLLRKHQLGSGTRLETWGEVGPLHPGHLGHTLGGPRPYQGCVAQAWVMVMDSCRRREANGCEGQLETWLHASKVQNILPHPSLHRRLPKLGVGSCSASWPCSLCPSLLCAYLPCCPHPLTPPPPLSVSHLVQCLSFLLGPALLSAPLPSLPNPHPSAQPPPSLWPPRPSYHRLASTCSWATFSNMTHGKGRKWSCREVTGARPLHCTRSPLPRAPLLSPPCGASQGSGAPTQGS